MSIFTILQIIISIFLIAVILLQAKGTGLGTAFGGSNQMYHSKRGMEKIVFGLTIFLAFAFIVLSVINLVL